MKMYKVNVNTSWAKNNEFESIGLYTTHEEAMNVLKREVDNRYKFDYRVCSNQIDADFKGCHQLSSYNLGYVTQVDVDEELWKDVDIIREPDCELDLNGIKATVKWHSVYSGWEWRIVLDNVDDLLMNVIGLENTRDAAKNAVIQNLVKNNLLK